MILIKEWVNKGRDLKLQPPPGIIDGEWRPARQQRGRVPGWGACSAGLWGVGARCGQIAHSRCSENAHRKGFVETIQKC